MKKSPATATAKAPPKDMVELFAPLRGLNIDFERDADPGNVVAVVDGAVIAATALEHNLTVVTSNVRHFADLAVPLLNPWEQQP